MSHEPGAIAPAAGVAGGHIACVRRIQLITRGIPEHVRRFVFEHIHSVAQLEVLLHLRSDGRERDAAAIAREHRMPDELIAAHLADLEQRALLRSRPGPHRVYRYDPQTSELADAVAGLAEAYAAQRARVVDMIFSKPQDVLLDFADAFRLRRK
jgi:hypothetical protein